MARGKDLTLSLYRLWLLFCLCLLLPAVALGLLSIYALFWIRDELTRLRSERPSTTEI